MNRTNRMLSRYLAGAGALLCASSVLAQTLVGQWDFNNGNLTGSTGGDLNFAEGPSGATDLATSFGTSTALGVPDIGGTPAQVMRFSANTNGSGFLMPIPSTPNGGGSQLNEWTLLMDVLYPAASTGRERPLVDIDGSIFSASPEIIVGSNNGLGVGGGATFGSLAANTWYRLGIVATADQLKFYTNGVLVGTTGSAGLDNRFALGVGSTALLFGTLAETGAAQGFVNSIQLRTGALSQGQMFALGGPSAAGVPGTIPPIPSFVQTWLPPGAVASRSTPLGVILEKGDSTVENSSISLKLDGTTLTGLQFVPNGSTVLVVKSNNTLSLANHTLELSYTDSVAGAKTFSHQFKSVLLFEGFEGLPLGTTLEEAVGTQNVWTPTPPPGWITNHSGMPGYGDPATDGMTEWAGWTFANKDFWITAAGDQTRVSFTLGQGTIAIADPDEWDDADHPEIDETTGAAFYFNSFLTTAPIDIAGVAANTMYLTFSSSWRPEGFDDWGTPATNNQTGTVTVSYDGGTPIEVLHYDSQEGGPFYKPDAQNEQVFIKLQNPANATNMVITFGLTKAANDWWWAFDNVEVGAGAIAPVIASQPESQTVSAGADVILSTTATGTEPLRYQWYFNNAPVTGATGNQLLLAAISTNNAGNYQVVVSNDGGSVTSRVAVISLFTGELTQDLVTHLKFEGNYADASGRNNAGTAVNSPTFEAGKIGQAVHLNSASSGDPNNYVTLGYPADLKFGSGNTAVNVTFSMWTKVLAHSGDKPFISNKDWDAGGNRGLVLSSQDDGFKWNYRDDVSPRRDGPTDGAVGPILNDGNWHHLAVTIERDGLARTYIDGQPVNATSIAPDPGNPIGSMDTDDLQMAWNLGQDGTGEYGSSLEVVMDDVGIWRRALTGQEVLAIYTAGQESKDLSLAEVPAGRVAPSITQQPVSQTVEEGVSASFSVVASGTPPLQYQWYRNNTPVQGATQSTLTLSKVEAGHAGAYTVTVTNLAGSVTSAAANLVVSPAVLLVTGQWDFNAGNLAATVGAALTNFDATVAADTQFGTTTQFGIPDVGGAPANVLYYNPSTSPWGGYIMPHGAAPNAGGSYVNRYSIIYDVLYPAASDATWRALLQTSTGNANDGDLFINTANGIGISGNYQGTVTPDVWHRIVVTIDLTSSTLKKYVDGQVVGTQTLGEGVDGRWSLDPVALLFADEDGETHAGYVNAIQFRSGVMSEAEVAALGGPSSGIPGMRPSISSIQLTSTGVVINWPGAPTRKLQQNSSLGTTGWTDVPGTTGASTVTVPATGAAAFFRLAE